MAIRETILISAPAEKVWPWVATPTGIALWNPKVVDVRRERDDPVQAGETFDMVFRMSSKETEVRVEVVTSRAYERVTYRHHYTSGSRQRYAEETYELTAEADATRVTQTVDLSAAGIPWIFRMIIAFISRFGRPVGKTYMERLRECVLNS